MEKGKLSLKALLLLTVFGLAACGTTSIESTPSSTQEPSSETQSSSESSETDKQYEIYRYYVAYMKAAGQTPKSYEEWLESIKGEKGDKGDNGTSLLSGTGVPSSNIGNKEDFYVDISSWDVYFKSSGGWIKTGNIKGEKGDNGQDGTPGQDGLTPYIGSNGNWWIGTQDTQVPATGPAGQTPTISINNSGYWVINGQTTNVRAQGQDGSPGQNGQQGNPGQNGKDGTSFRNGEGEPANTLGIDGDSYLDYSTYDLYIKSGGAWIKVGNISSGGHSADYFTITFNANGGSGTQTDILTNGTFVLPECTFEAPVGKAFAAWSYNSIEYQPGHILVTESDTEVTAVWTNSVHTVTWNNYDGYTLEVDENVPYGATPHYDGDIPEKPSTAQYSYEFSGWDPTISTVTGNITYTAQFTPVTQTYNVTWLDDNDNTLRVDNLEYGAMPSYGSDPTKNSTSQYRYNFSGWDNTPVEVTGEATYKATFSSTIKNYTITWQNYDGTVIKTTSVPYGTIPTYTGSTPFKPDDAICFYEFSGWDTEPVAVTNNATYTATFDPVDAYSITYDSGPYSQGNPDENLFAPTVTKGSFIAPEFNGNTRPFYGLTFFGWRCGDNLYQPGDQINVDSDVTLVADLRYVLSINYTPTNPNGVVAYYGDWNDYQHSSETFMNRDGTSDYWYGSVQLGEGNHKYNFVECDRDNPSIIYNDDLLHFGQHNCGDTAYIGGGYEAGYFYAPFEVPAGKAIYLSGTYNDWAVNEDARMTYDENTKTWYYPFSNIAYSTGVMNQYKFVVDDYDSPSSSTADFNLLNNYNRFAYFWKEKGKLNNPLTLDEIGGLRMNGEGVYRAFIKAYVDNIDDAYMDDGKIKNLAIRNASGTIVVTNPSIYPFDGYDPEATLQVEAGDELLFVAEFTKDQLGNIVFLENGAILTSNGAPLSGYDQEHPISILQATVVDTNQGNLYVVGKVNYIGEEIASQHQKLPYLTGAILPILNKDPLPSLWISDDYVQLLEEDYDLFVPGNASVLMKFKWSPSHKCYMSETLEYYIIDHDIEEHSYYLLGSFNEWEAKDSSYLMTPDPINTNLVSIQNVTLAAGTVFKVMDNNDAFWPAFSSEPKTIVEDGIYTITLDLSKEDSAPGQFTITKTGEYISGYNIVIGEGDPTPVANDTAIVGDNNYAFKVDLEAGDTLVVRHGGTALYLGDSGTDTSYVAPLTGEYTVYVNQYERVYIVDPSEETLDRYVHIGKDSTWKAEEITDVELTYDSTLGCYYSNPIEFKAGNVFSVCIDQENTVWLDVRDLMNPDYSTLYHLSLSSESYDLVVLDDVTFVVKVRYIPELDVKELYLDYVAPETIEVYKGEVKQTIESSVVDYLNYAIYNMELEKGDVITIKGDNVALPFCQWDPAPQRETIIGYSFVAPVEGDYTFYVNTYNQVYITTPSVTPSYAGRVQTGTDEPVAAVLTPVEMSPAEAITNNAVYTIELTKGQTITFYNNDVKMYFASYDETIGIDVPGDNFYVAPRTGLYTFYMSKNTFFYVTAPSSGYTATVKTGESAPVPASLVVKAMDESEQATNVAKYEVTLASEDILRIYKDDDIMELGGETPAEYFVASKTGVHTVYISNDGCYYVVSPSGVEFSNYAYLVREGEDDQIIELSPNGENECLIENLSLQVGDILSFHVVDGEEVEHWIKYNKITGRNVNLDKFTSCTASGDNNGNIEVVTAGTYSFYVQLSGTSIWIEEYTNVTFNVAHDAGTGNAIFAIGSFSNNEASSDYKLTYDSVNNKWTGNLVLPIGSSFRLAVATEAGGKIDDAYIFEGEPTRLVTASLVVNEWQEVEEPDPEITYTDYYLRGDFNDWGATNSYRFVESSDPNNIGELLNVHLTAGDFKVAYANWDDNTEIGYYGYSIGGTQYWYNDTTSGAHNESVDGSAASSFGKGSGSGACNINCSLAGDYNIYLGKDYRLYIVEA